MNVLLDQNDNVKLADFGLSKMNFKNTLSSAKMSLCGTIQYLPPEMALGNYYNETADWWSFGIIIYEMICGKLPFDHDERSIIVKDIVSKELKFKKIFSEEAQDLISKLLVKDPKSRLGHDGVGDIMNHEFFKDVDWEELTATKIERSFSVKTPKGYSKY
mmetsp:Transcript_23307/g.20682  ORF Transcript_23307/g.20682 Transcript_23307/m.20682 type:complete len:160 (+) Transcript_23307:613-1092(+)